MKQSTSFLAENTFKMLSNTIISQNNGQNYNFLKNHHQLSFSLRGPPQTV